VTTGCSSFRDVFTSHAETAARVGTHQLKSAYVADIISRVGGGNANPQAAEAVTNVWVDIALFGDGVARGTLKSDSAYFERLLWPQLAQNRTTAWHDTLVAHRQSVSPNAADSAYEKGDLRLFQHILITPKGTTAADTAKARAQAEGLVSPAKVDFAKVAAQYSADAANKGDKGYLPPAPRRTFDSTFEATAWGLQPGQVSGVVHTPFGYHIIRRPPASEVRDRFVGQLNEAHRATQDSLYFAEMAVKNKVTVKSGAAASVRSALADLRAARNSHKDLVTFRNGSFTVADFARWMGALPVQQAAAIRQANDTLINQFLRNLAQNTILLREADSARIAVNPKAYQGLIDQFKNVVAELKQTMGLGGPEFADSSKTPVAERVKLAEKKVDDYFDKLTKGEAQYRQLPPTLSAELRAVGDFKIYQAGIARAQELVVAHRRADSAAGARAPAGPASPPAPPPGTLQPAPGGPPTPGKKP
jgi:hypothetical protein